MPIVNLTFIVRFCLFYVLFSPDCLYVYVNLVLRLGFVGLGLAVDDIGYYVVLYVSIDYGVFRFIIVSVMLC